MIEEFNNRSFGILANVSSRRRDLSFAELRIYYNEKNKTLNNCFMETLGLLTELNLPNYVAYLMSDENGNSMKVAKFLGKDKMELIENYEFGYCSLIKATKSILDRLEIENTKRVKSCSQGLIETTLVDKIALKEAVINAVVHNDYSREIPPVVMIYSDRIEITSMGGLPEHISEDDFFSGVSHPVNKEIARIFQDLGLVQNIGNGIKKITDIYGREAYKFYRDHIIVSLPFNIKK